MTSKAFREVSKEKYASAYAELKVLINEFDPCGLIETGAPDKEYDYLTHSLIDLLNEGITIKAIKDLIIHEMQNHFRVDVPISEPYFSKFFTNLNDFAVKVRQLGFRGFV